MCAGEKGTNWSELKSLTGKIAFESLNQEIIQVSHPNKMGVYTTSHCFIRVCLRERHSKRDKIWWFSAVALTVWSGGVWNIETLQCIISFECTCMVLHIAFIDYQVQQQSLYNQNSQIDDFCGYKAWECAAKYSLGLWMPWIWGQVVGVLIWKKIFAPVSFLVRPLSSTPLFPHITQSTPLSKIPPLLVVFIVGKCGLITNGFLPLRSLKFLRHVFTLPYGWSICSTIPVQ
jgi:hypothetical protein